MKKNVFILYVLISSFYCFAERIEIESISASSTLSSQSNLYDVNHLIDGTDKSWVEGEEGSGTGTVITINFKKPEEIQTFYIKNGYGDFKHYYENNRVRKLNCTFTERGFVNIILEDKPGFQKVEFDTPVITDKLVLTIKDVYSGTKYNDTAISEISFDDWDKLKHQDMNFSIIKYRVMDIFNRYKTKDSMITDRTEKSLFSFPRPDSWSYHHLFETNCEFNILPLKDGGMYFLSSLSSELMGQKRTSPHDDLYILLSKLEGEKIVPCQNEFISLGNESDIKELELALQRKDLKNEEKVFIEKYLKIVSDLEDARKTNLPFLSPLFCINLSKDSSDRSEIVLHINDLYKLPWTWNKLWDILPGLNFRIKYCAASEIISEVHLP